MLDRENAFGAADETEAVTAAFASALTGFREALQSSWSSPAAEQQVVKAYEKYSATLQQAWQIPEVSERASEAYAEYIHSVREAFATAGEQARVDDAFHQFARELKKAWNSIDPASITPQEMAAIAEGILWVTGVVGVVHHAGAYEP